MERCIITPRPNWEYEVVKDGLSYYNLEGLRWTNNMKVDGDFYWNEAACL
jgi:hypothetical protein